MSRIFLFLLSALPLFSGLEEKPFLIVIPSYNNELYCQTNVRSALRQKYENYRIIFINDSSTDRTLELVKREVEKSLQRDRVTIIDNKERHLALANYYYAIHDYAEDDEIVITLDGDDQLAFPGILGYLNRIYSNPKNEIWLTYGQLSFKSKPNGKSWVSPMPEKIIRKNAFREHTHLPSHLRSFYAWLFKLIEEEDLKMDGEFYPMTWDVAMMLPMIEMARDHFTFIPTVLYIYNDENTLNDHKTSQELQFFINREIRKKPAYTPLLRRP